MDKPVKNFQLTRKALEFIWKHGRNTFDAMTREKDEETLLKEGYINDKKRLDIVGDIRDSWVQYFIRFFR